MAHIDGISHLSFSVTDLARSREWYVRVFGLDVVAEFDGNGFRRARMRGSGGLTVTLTAHEATTGGRFDERVPGLDHVAFRLAEGSDLDALVARLDELGTEHSGVKRLDDGRCALTLRDPDNIQLEVFTG